MTAVIARPEPAAELCAEDVYEVRLIDAPPSSLHPPSQFAAAARASPAKPPVPLFFTPRVALITNKPHELKKLREAAERDVAARDAASGSASAAAPSLRLAPAAASQRTPSPRISRPPTPSAPMVPWSSIDDD